MALHHQRRPNPTPPPLPRTLEATLYEEVRRRQQSIEQFQHEQDAAFGPFTAQSLTLDTSALLRRSTELDGKFFGKKKGRRLILGELGPYLRAPVPLAGLTEALQKLDATARKHADLCAYVASLNGISLRSGWTPVDGGDSRWFDQSVQRIRAAARLYQVVEGLARGSKTSLNDLDLVAGQVANIRAANLGDLGHRVRRLARAWASIRQLLNVDGKALTGWLDGRPPMTAVLADLPRWRADAAGDALVNLQRWLRVRAGLDWFLDLNMTDLAQRAYLGQIDPYELEPQVRLGVTKAVLEERLTTTGLSGFDEADHARRIAQFDQRSHDARRRMPNELRSRVVGGRTFNPNAKLGQVAELRNELSRRRGGRSVRRLLHDFQALISEITPCLLMSPQSVARFLPPITNFDLVVFDEASQIRVPESIGAIGRAKATVIVGDSKQMPPTSAFASGDGTTDDSPKETVGLAPADLESILSEAVESQFPRKLLSWHYRSRNEALIAFSNAHYYEGRLSSFPIAPGSDSDAPIELRRVGGTWEGGGSGAARVNRAEATEIVSEIKQLTRKEPGRTVGVVTFNSQQRDLILDLLETDGDPGIADQLARDSEPLFVKNLENVQGDERDVILFSLAYSPDKTGRVPLNWGPLTRAGGERRLNVAVTRAKERVVVFSSFDPQQLDLSNSSSQGLSDLKDYLLMASVAARTEKSSSKRDTRDAQVDDVALALAKAGLDVRQNIGLSDFVVDIAVREPGSTAWIAVLLDGPAWASRLSVGDRETLPTSVLTQMKWAGVERVWLPTWLRSRQTVVDTVRTSAADRARAARLPVAENEATPSAAMTAPPADPGTWRLMPAELSDAPKAEPVESRPTAVGPAESGPVAPTAPITRSLVFRPSHERATHATGELDDPRWASVVVGKEMQNVIETEAPILLDRLLQVTARRFDLARLRESRRSQLLDFVPASGIKRAANGDKVVWAQGRTPSGYTDFRVPLSGGKRDLQIIPYDELRNAMVYLARAAYSIDAESLIKETARLFGVNRVASVGRARLEGVLRAAVVERSLTDVNGLLSAPVACR